MRSIDLIQFIHALGIAVDRNLDVGVSYDEVTARLQNGALLPFLQQHLADVPDFGAISASAASELSDALSQRFAVWPPRGERAAMTNGLALLIVLASQLLHQVELERQLKQRSREAATRDL